MYTAFENMAAVMMRNMSATMTPAKGRRPGPAVFHSIRFRTQRKLGPLRVQRKATVARAVQKLKSTKYL
jgi:hypothetical protein